MVRRDLEAAFTDHADDQAFIGQLRASVTENLRTLQELLCGRRTLSDVQPDQALIFGEVQAQLGIPQATLQKSYRVGFVAMWEAWMHELVAQAAAARISTGEALSASGSLLGAILAYQDHVTSLVADAHARTGEALNQSRAHLRRRIVRDLMRSEVETLTPSDLATLGYDLEVHHLALVCTELAEGAASALAIGLRAATGARESLVYARGLRSSAIWLGHRDGWSASRRNRLLDALETAGVCASMGEPHRGLNGFRQGFQQALDVEVVRSAWDPAGARG